MSENRLIYTDNLQEEVESLRIACTGLRAGKGVLNEFAKQYRESVLRIIDEQPTIDPETLPIVRGLREKLYKAEKEIESLKGIGSLNCISCDMMHKNGNCLAVGGFCTSVPAMYCKLIPELREKLSRYEQAKKEGRLLELPSKEVLESRGDYVYAIYDYEVVELVNCSVQIGTDGTVYVVCCADDKIFPYREGDPEHDTEPSDWCTQYIDFDISEFGKTVFLTAEEAEAALKERENA